MRKTILLLVSVALVMVLVSGVALALTTIRCQQPENPWVCEGTEEDDRMLGTDAHGSMYGFGGNDVLRGFGGGDSLTGGEGDDRLFGGSYYDAIDPGPGDDASYGGEDGDSYLFHIDAWGHDTITDTAILDNDPPTGNAVSFTYITEGLTINLVSSEGQPEVTNASGTATVNWSANVIYRTTGGEGDDTIYGNAAANGIHAMGPGGDSPNGVPSGDDTVFARGGNDTIWARDLDGNTKGDRVDCGEGTDKVYYERGDVVRHCEKKHPYPIRMGH
jgi:Ca2+-binding RTX toxin-like protein